MSYANRNDSIAETNGETITRHRWTAATPPTHAVVESVAQRAGVDETELPPLYDAIDPDALDAIFDHRGDWPSDAGPRVIFSYAGFEVTVEHDGWLTIYNEFDHNLSST